MAGVWAEIEALWLNGAERKLVAACKAGDVCVLGDGTRPEGPDPEREVRAEVLRYLILGGSEDCRVHETGVQLVGAWVSGVLDLSFGRARGQTLMFRCRFEDRVLALQTRFELLNLGGTALRGLNAQGAEFVGGVMLREGFVAEGEVRLSGSRIGGQLDCIGGQFQNAEGWALFGQGIEVTNSVLLRAGFVAVGEVSLSSARIGGQLDCCGGTFVGAEDIALNAQRMQVSGGVLWRGVSLREGTVNLASAHVSDLVDDLDSWPEAGRLILHGFTFDKISGGFTNVKQRLDWLARGTVWEGEFFPQPYTQLAKVYRGMGHDSAARVVLIERNRLLAVYQRKALRGASDDPSLKDVAVLANWLGDFAMRRLVGYGYAPFRSFWALLILWLAASWLAFTAWNEGSMVPNSDVVLTSSGWQAYEVRDDAGAAWSARGAPGQDWETFSAWAWGADLVVPIVDVGQVAAWAPSTGRGGVGRLLWWARWVLVAAGWIVAGLFAAAITGIIRREED